MDAVFSEQERKVFSYYDGAQRVFGDPMRILRGMLREFAGDPNPALENMNHAEAAVWVPAMEGVVAAVRIAFDMVPYDKATGTGATEADCLAALHAWQEYLNSKKAPAAS